MYDVFLSYRRNTGSEFGSLLSAELTRMGYDVFFDALSLREGDFKKHIDDAIDQCTFFLLLLSPGDLERCLTAPEKDWIIHESQRALNSGKVIIPVKIKEGFEFPEECDNETIQALAKNNICDLSGVNAAELINTRLLTFMNDYPAKKLADSYNKGISDPDYLKWELETLKGIYYEIDLINVFDKEYPAFVIPGSESVKYPFNGITQDGKLYGREAEIDYTGTPWYNDFKKIVGPHVHFPNLYGYTSCGYNFDSQGKIKSINSIPRTYKETVYTCHILHYELWAVYQQIGKERPATLDDLPLRKAIHGGKSNMEVILSGCNRSSLNDVTIAVIDYNERTDEYGIATATRSQNVATFPGYFGFVPSGGFELYELEDNQNEVVLKENYYVLGALFREYIEELFGDCGFGKATGDDDLNRLYKNSKVRSLEKGIRNGTYKFEFLGVDFDLITLRQTLAFVLRIDDENFYYDNEIKKNEENVYVKFQPLKTFEEYVISNNIPVMEETASTYALLKNHPLYKEIEANDFRLA